MRYEESEDIMYGTRPGSGERGSRMAARVCPLLFALFILALLASAGCLGQTYDEDRNGATIPVRPGDTIRIGLSETPSTGYLWNVTLTGDLVITETGFFSLGSFIGPPGGDSGTRSWTLTAGHASVQKFSAIKVRGDDPSWAWDRFEMTFTVQE